MDVISIPALLEQWEELISIGEQTALEKASKNKDGLSGRIRRTTGVPVIFDFDSHQDQQKIQDLLCKRVPQFADLIRSVPEIMNGYPWTRRDFIELYFAHYRLIAEKLRRLTNKSTNV